MINKAKIQKEEIGYSASIENLWIFTQGDTLDELYKNLKEARDLYYADDNNFEKNKTSNQKSFELVF
jgi:predicted RNase H-like HicB family nuclease